MLGREEILFLLLFLSFVAIAYGQEKRLVAIKLMNGNEYVDGDIITIQPGEATDFKVLEDTITTVIKLPSVKNDKYIV